MQRTDIHKKSKKKPTFAFLHPGSNDDVVAPPKKDVLPFQRGEIVLVKSRGTHARSSNLRILPTSKME